MTHNVLSLMIDLAPLVLPSRFLNAMLVSQLDAGDCGEAEQLRSECMNIPGVFSPFFKKRPSKETKTLQWPYFQSAIGVFQKRLLSKLS